MENEYQKFLNACKDYRAKVEELLETNNELHDRLWAINDDYNELEAENAALRAALENIMTESDEQIIWGMARAALEKEAHP
jgi:hypothetical protein